MSKFTFTMTDAATKTTDSAISLFCNGVKTRIYIQDCSAYGAGFQVNADHLDTDDGFVRHHGSRTDLEAAKELAIATYRNGEFAERLELMMLGRQMTLADAKEHAIANGYRVKSARTRAALTKAIRCAA